MSQPARFLLTAMMKSQIVLAFYAGLSHTFLEGERLKEEKRRGFLQEVELKTYWVTQ